MKINDLKNKKIAFLGLGLENLSLIKYLSKNKLINSAVVFDYKTTAQLSKRLQSLKNYPLEFKLGKDYKNNLSGYDYYFRSPGFPIFDEKIKNIKNKLLSPTNFFLTNSPTKNIIAVTGSKGKGTTATLIYKILKAAKKDVYLGGNIGIAPFDFFSKLKKNSWVVLELSSFQTEDLQISPKIAVFTNIFAEHLKAADKFNPNYHKSFQSYFKSKLRLLSLADQKNIGVINEKLKDKIKPAKVNSRLVYYQKSQQKSKLAGEHNKENIAAAEKTAEILKINKQIVKKAVANFTGLEHRQEFLGKIKNKLVYNDSFATIPESTLTALQAFNQPITLVAGGASKNSDFRMLAKKIKEKTAYLILFKGQGSVELKKEVLKIGYAKNKIKTVNSMTEAVKLAFANSAPESVILLSPACASFGLFENYKQRGELFKKAITKFK